MNKYNDLKYITQLPLRNLKKIPVGYVCSCYKCNEGRSPWKTRMFFLTQKKDFTVVYCQNCGYDTNFKTFLKDNFPATYEDYLKEERSELLNDLKNGTLVIKEKKIQNIINSDLELKYVFRMNKDYFKKAKYYPAAVEFCKRRHITDHIDDLYYNIHPDHALSGMVVFPFYLEDKYHLYGLQGRHTEFKKFHTHSKNESMKIYNFYHVDFELPVYIFEAIIDSLTFDNSLAMLGVSLSDAVLSKMRNPIYILDNDKRGIETALKYAGENKNIFVYPKSFKYKDFNAAICDGVKKSELKQMVTENTFKGFAATVKLNMLKSGRKF